MAASAVEDLHRGLGRVQQVVRGVEVMIPLHFLASSTPTMSGTSKSATLLAM